MEPVLSVKGLGKSYVRNRFSGARTLGDGHANLFSRRKDGGGKETFWALRDISFDVMPGEVLGILGSNGAGKSTLLKILSRITAPTTGEAILRGRVGSLLEVGTGFHEELTGRENIYLNGTILGMTRSEITQKLDEIVDFSGVAPFLDTPVKRYSSGMVTRLAFAVAANLEPEILIVDEVLAVGDVAFQKKCLGKMKDVTSEGRTVLFVSHNIGSVRQLCTRGLYLKQGELLLDSPDIDEAVFQYMHSGATELAAQWHSEPEPVSFDCFTPRAFYLADADGNVLDRPAFADEEIQVHLEYHEQAGSNVAAGFEVSDAVGNVIFWSYNSDDYRFAQTANLEERHEYTTLPVNCLNSGEYTLTLVAGIHGQRSLLPVRESTIKLRLEVEGNKQRATHLGQRRASIIAPILYWREAN
ncbi:MAG: ATP-binding cassette domain-containing protein [Desulfovibrio sp.]|jgi:lipopolysaccharide transport system ATP-binding protein|nr:ATP-binding cassette domain-containing protein [Desulfovibrio sp.]